MSFQYEKYYDPEDGKSLVLTIDETIQHILEKHLEQAIVDHYVENRVRQSLWMSIPVKYYDGRYRWCRPEQRMGSFR